MTPRIGFRLHLLSNLRQAIVKERRPKRRLVIRDLLRLEWRNLYYSSDKADSSTVRLRNRLQSLWPLNRSLITDNGVAYLNADWEWFIPFDDPDERLRAMAQLLLPVYSCKLSTTDLEVETCDARAHEETEEGGGRQAEEGPGEVRHLRRGQ